MTEQTAIRIKAQPTQDGAGVKIRRINDFTGTLDPFLMVDELKSDVEDDYIGGFPPHPHRGFETLTYLLHGGLKHQDSHGHHGEVNRGGAQWMRAGSGVIHSEMPLTDTDGLHGFQIWINLPARLKMTDPTYRDLQGEDIPEIGFDGGSARLIADNWQFNGTPGSGVLPTLGDGAGMADLRLDADASAKIDLPEGYRLIAYVYEGNLPGTADSGELAVFAPDRDTIELKAGETAGVLLMAGRPLREPVAHRGPFVMNTMAEIEQAVRDYQSGVMG